MNILKIIKFISIIALVQQGLFFPLSASEDLKIKIPIGTNSETSMNTPLAKDNPLKSPHPPFTKRGLGMINEKSLGIELLSREKISYEQAKQQAERGLVDLAIPDLKKIVELYPDNIEAHAYLGWAYSQKELIPQAVEEFQKVLEINPNLQRVPFDFPMVKFLPATIKEFTTSFEDVVNYIDEFAGAHEVLGLCYALLGRLGDALNEYKKVLSLEPNYIGKEPFVGRKKIIIDQAINEYEEIIRLKPDCVEAYIKLACAHSEKGMLDQSIADVKKAISIEPERIDTHVYLGCFYVKKWLLEEALKELSEAKKARDSILEKLLTEGEGYIHNCIFDKAISVAKEALKVSPRNKKAYWQLAMAYSRNGEIDRAIEVCKEIIYLFPDEIRVYALLGWIYAQCDLLEEATSLAGRAIHKDPESSEIRALMVFLYASQNQINEAIFMCNMILNKTSGENIVLEDYGWIKGKVSSIEQKFREVMDVLEIKPDYAEAYLCLGWLYSKNSASEKAIAAYKKAIELMPDSHKVYLCLGNIYVQKGKIKNALDAYDNALKILSRKARENVTQGLTYYKNGNIERAISCFNDVLKIDPENEEVYFLLANAYEKKGLYGVGMILRSHGEKIKKGGNNLVF